MDNTDNRFPFWQKWLTFANVATVFVGIAVAFFGDTILFELHNSYTKDVFFEGLPFDPEVLKLKKWLFGIIGGTIVGFHVLMIFISENAFKRKERWAYLAMWSGLLSWFAIDTSLSIYHGAIHNVVLINLVALFLIGLPLIMTYRHFYKKA